MTRDNFILGGAVTMVCLTDIRAPIIPKDTPVLENAVWCWEGQTCKSGTLMKSEVEYYSRGKGSILSIQSKGKKVTWSFLIHHEIGLDNNVSLIQHIFSFK